MTFKKNWNKYLLIINTAPHDYMVRPPQPAVYLMLLDVSHSAVKTGYLKLLCDVRQSICHFL